MQNFSYKKQINPEDVIINVPKKKINKQQIVFTLFFIITFGSLGWYFTKDIFVTTFDGNIVSYHSDSYLMDDILLLDIKVKPGDIISAGDTILLYIYTSMLYSAMNPIEFSDYEKKEYSTRMAKTESVLRLKTLIQQKKSLQKLADETRNNISLRLNTVSDEIDYSIEIENVNREINYTRNIIKYYGNSLDSLNSENGKSTSQILDPLEHTKEYIYENMYKFGNILQYMVASEKTLILAINKYPGNIVFKKESIMLVYPIIEGRKNIHIEMIVQPRFLNEMVDNEEVEIYFGEKYFGDGIIKINNTYMKDVSSFKLGQFSAEKEAAIIRVNIDSAANLALKYQVRGLPVKLRYTRRW